MDIMTPAVIALASAANSAMPGPCIAMTLGRSARDGFSAGLPVSAGVVFANLALCVAALSIMQGLLAVSATAYATMKWAGIAVLLILAIRMLRNTDRQAPVLQGKACHSIRDVSAGLAVGLSSPYNLIFLLALLPQLVPAGNLTLMGAALITSAVLVGAAISLTGAVLIGTFSGRITRGAGRRIERIGALSMVGFAGLAGATPIA